MTIKRENDEHPLYYQIEFVEFLEMIARIADIKYKNTI